MSTPAELDVLTSKVRRLEANVAQLQDAISVYGPPKERPLFSVRVPRVSISERHTTVLVYSLFLLAIGVYTLAKMRHGEMP